MVSASFATDLLTWFAAHRRDLPWRKQKAGERLPYEVWVSEMMLQQTQVASVVPYFERWLKRFPDLTTLAKSTLDEVLKLWEGLGYYRRAQLLHQCAIKISQNHAGVFPQNS